MCCPEVGDSRGAKAKPAILLDGGSITKSNLAAPGIAGPQFDYKFLKFLKFSCR